jgi:hypothetical protein
MMDMAKKGRAKHVNGEASGHAVLTEIKVSEIKLMLAAGCFCVDIAKTFCVSHSTIQHIKFGRSWGHVVV